MSYASDRQFTDYVHELAIRDIYPKMDWVVQDVNNRLSVNIDMNNAVDYMAVDRMRRIITIQERFRESKYSRYSDFTLRYMRPENRHEERRLSEFFKLDADYFVYGIIDSPKYNVNSNSRFLKIAIINLKTLMDRVDDGVVVIDESMREKRCRQVGNTMHCPRIPNWDHSSDFVPFDILILDSIAPEVVEYQEGFL